MNDLYKDTMFGSSQGYTRLIWSVCSFSASVIIFKSLILGKLRSEGTCSYNLEGPV